MNNSTTAVFCTEVGIARASVLSVIGLLTVVSNITCLLALQKTGSINHQTRLFLRSLAISDVYVVLLVLTPSLGPIALGHWLFGDNTCIACSVLQVSSIYTENLSFLCVSIDRYICITKPFAYHRIVTPCRAKFMVSSIWILSSGLAIANAHATNWHAQCCTVLAISIHFLRCRTTMILEPGSSPSGVFYCHSLYL